MKSPLLCLLCSFVTGEAPLLIDPRAGRRTPTCPTRSDGLRPPFREYGGSRASPDTHQRTRPRFGALCRADRRSAPNGAKALIRLTVGLQGLAPSFRVARSATDYPQTVPVSGLLTRPATKLTIIPVAPDFQGQTGLVPEGSASPHYARDAVARSWRSLCHRATAGPRA
jgi:hypothetical protein